jgi:hypothetical protein
MGTDRWEKHSEPCPCGKGRFVVEHVEPDHGWSTWTATETSITCSDCSQQYVLVQQDGHVALVTAQNVAAKKKAESARHEARGAFFASKPVQDLLSEAEAALAALPSMAARHHVLTQMGHIGSVATFRKNMASSRGAGWLARYASDAGTVVKLLHWLKKTDPAIRARVVRG